MKQIFLPLLVFLVVSCKKDKSLNQPIDNSQAVLIDSLLLPDSISYANYITTYWPNFGPNTNLYRNVLLENFVGHRSVNSPYGDITALNLTLSNPLRVFSVNLHIGPNGATVFQEPVNDSVFSTDFISPIGIEISNQLTDQDFIGIPMGLLNRKIIDGHRFYSPSYWSGLITDQLTQNDLRVNLQADVNYFSQTRGVFLHTEVDVLNPTGEDLYSVIYLIEDSVVSPQMVQYTDSFPYYQNDNYIHRNILRTCIDGLAMGRKILDTDKVDKYGNLLQGNKFYLNYSYYLPTQYNPANMHLLIYVYNSSTKEIYQVIRKNLLE